MFPRLVSEGRDAGTPELGILPWIHFRWAEVCHGGWSLCMYWVGGKGVSGVRKAHEVRHMLVRGHARVVRHLVRVVSGVRPGELLHLKTNNRQKIGKT